MNALIISPRIGNGATDSNAHRPQVYDDYGVSFIDDCNQPALRIGEQYDPAIMTVSIVCDAATLDAIGADPDYYILHADNRPSGGIPPAAEFGLLRAYLAQEGVSQATINGLLGGSPAGRTREEIAAILRAYLVTLPKASPQAMAAMITPVPFVTVFGRTLPLCSRWTWAHVGIIRRLYYALST